jgi:hypothetical protein
LPMGSRRHGRPPASSSSRLGRSGWITVIRAWCRYRR